MAVGEYLVDLLVEDMQLVALKTANALSEAKRTLNASTIMWQRTYTSQIAPGKSDAHLLIYSIPSACIRVKASFLYSRAPNAPASITPSRRHSPFWRSRLRH